MRTTRLLTAWVSVATTRCQYRGVGPQVNKFEQVSSNDLTDITFQQLRLVGGKNDFSRK